MDERSLIKKYQREINELRQELESLRASMASEQRSLPDLRASPSASEEDLTALRQQVIAHAHLICIWIPVDAKGGIGWVPRQTAYISISKAWKGVQTAESFLTVQGRFVFHSD